MIHPYNYGETQGIQQLFHNPHKGITTFKDSYKIFFVPYACIAQGYLPTT